MDNEQQYSEILEAYLEALKNGEKFNFSTQADEELQQVLSLARFLHQETHDAPEASTAFIARVRQALPSVEEPTVEEADEAPLWSWVSAMRFVGVSLATLVVIIGVVLAFPKTSDNGVLSRINKPIRSVKNTLTNSTEVASDLPTNAPIAKNQNTNANTNSAPVVEPPRDDTNTNTNTNNGNVNTASNANNNVAATGDDVVVFTDIDLSALNTASGAAASLLEGLSDDMNESVEIATDAQLASMSKDLDFSLEN